MLVFVCAIYVCHMVFVWTANMYHTFSVMKCRFQPPLGYLWERISPIWKRDLRCITEFEIEVKKLSQNCEKMHISKINSFLPQILFSELRLNWLVFIILTILRAVLVAPFLFCKYLTKNWNKMSLLFLCLHLWAWYCCENSGLCGIQVFLHIPQPLLHYATSFHTLCSCIFPIPISPFV